MASTTDYPIIRNCNYESGDEDARTIHKIRLAVDAGLTADPDLLSAMEDLEDTLNDYAERSDETAVEACRDAERVVLDAWTDDVREAVERERRSRYSD